MDVALETGVPIPKDHRRETIFHSALDRVREGRSRGEIIEEAMRVNREQCRPPVAEDLVRKQVAGALMYAHRRPRSRRSLRAGHARCSTSVASDRRRQPPRSLRPRGMGGAGTGRHQGRCPRFRDRPAARLARRVGDRDHRREGRRARPWREPRAWRRLGGIARHVQVSPRPGWCEPVNLYVIVPLARRRNHLSSSRR